LTLAVIGIIWGAVAATMQKDLKRLVAYSSVAHLGFIVLGTFAFTAEAMGGGVMQMINHGVSTGALFLLVGMIYERRHTRLISELKGLQKVAPIFAAAFMVVMLSSIGVPGLNGFVGEFLILIGSFNTARWWAVVAATGVILAALYLLWAYQRVFHGEPDEANSTFRELRLREGLVLLPFIGIIIFCGVYPKPMLDRIEPSVKAILERVEEKTGYVAPHAVELESHEGEEG
jgi:NADH-quinone oxidoreductase subunit M